MSNFKLHTEKVHISGFLHFIVIFPRFLYKSGEFDSTTSGSFDHVNCQVEHSGEFEQHFSKK